ncbi:MAG: FAD:protein FMN transferase [Actinomycetota bacterium]|jgi:thiamine biosynthesis lipoprotein|nr:FAD:protein FMN transferase [Actinomycetota bacterium]
MTAGTTLSSSTHELVHVEHVMGTAVSLHLRVRASARELSATVGPALERACAALHDADAVFSTWNPQSPLSKVRSGTLALEAAPEEIHEVLDTCRYVRALTGGWFDPWAMPGGVDPTGIVKGWAVERALGALRVPDIVAASVNAGGDIAVFGRPATEGSWRIGVRHPWRPDALACVVLVDHAVATSGTYERGPHLVDPRTHEPLARGASATIVGPSLTLADGLATALAVGGNEVLSRLVEVPRYEGYLVRADGTEAWTEGMTFAA